MADSIQSAAEHFVATLFRARDRAASSDEFSEDRDSNAAYDRLFKAIAKVTPEEVKLGWAVSEFAALTFSQSVWNGQVKRDTALRDFLNALQNLIDDLSVVEWLACVPLGREFRGFSKFTDLGPIAVVYVPDDEKKDQTILLAEFREVLTAHCGVHFMDSAEVKDSYLRLGGHYYERSQCYIPGRPQMIVKVGRGESRSNERMLGDRLRQLFPLFQFCQVVEAPPILAGARFIAPSYWPDRKSSMMTQGLIEIPDGAVAVNRRTGQCDWWQNVRPFSVYETWDGNEHDAARFQLAWHEHVEPILKLHDDGLSGRVREAIDNAVRLVAACRYPQFVEPLLNCVIATETILNPFNTLEQLSERFALFSAALCASNPIAKRTAYRQSKKLYRLRCHAVHRSHMDDQEDMKSLRQEALGLFLTCLRSIVKWADETLGAGGSCDQKAFDDFYLRSIFSQ